jgi:hypothetical protein
LLDDSALISKKVEPHASHIVRAKSATTLQQFQVLTTRLQSNPNDVLDALNQSNSPDIEQNFPSHSQPAENEIAQGDDECRMESSKESSTEAPLSFMRSQYNKVAPDNSPEFSTIPSD